MRGASGNGGGGAGGAIEPCTDDPSCATKAGDGSLCIAQTCTKATAACDKATLAVVPEGFAGTLGDDVANACYHRTFEAALGAFVADTPTRLVVHVETLTVPTPL
ncbi:MAG: hypothetical protein MUF34_15355, partial [Polyangiaceae bacterium]|nr:hypothetical protein [Polyangiaceae bacterium]